MPKRDFAEIVQEICGNDSRYSIDCYLFVREGLDHTLKHMKRGPAPAGSARGHVTGRELLQGLRDYALAEFGPMSKSVLNEWGVKRCEDFGEVVFNLVRHGVLGKTESDSLNDFKDGFSFEEAFVKPFRPRSKAAAAPASTAPRARRPRKNKPAEGKAPKSKPGSSQA